MKILFLHGWHSVVGGVKPTYLKDAGHEVINPALDDDDFEAAVETAQAEYDQHMPNVVVGSSRGGAVAMNIKSGDTPLVLLCPAWKKWGTVKRLKPNAVILHSRADDVIPFDDSEELVLKSGLREETLNEVGTDHRLAEREPLQAMLVACDDLAWSEKEQKLLDGNWSGLCYTAALRWISDAKMHDWQLVHSTVYSGALEKRIEHAWCERNGVVVDLTMPAGSKVFSEASFYTTVDPAVSFRYSHDEALFISIKTRNDGPWTDVERKGITD